MFFISDFCSFLSFFFHYQFINERFFLIGYIFT